MASYPAREAALPPSRFFITVAQVVAVEDSGLPIVLVQGESLPRPASYVAVDAGRSDSGLRAGAAVVVAVDEADVLPPIVLAPVGQAAEAAIDEEGLRAEGRRVDAAPTKERLVFESEREIVLRCGRSSITLTRDGKVLVKGVDVVSRASGSNKIRGASVKIN